MMTYEFTVEADSQEELEDALTSILTALRATRAPGILRFSRFPSAQDYGGNVVQMPLRTVPIDQPEPEIKVEEPPAPRRRGRPPKTNGSEAPASAPVVVQNPDGGLAAVTRPMETLEALRQEAEADPAIMPPEGMKPPPEDTGVNMAPSDMRERSINLMQQAFGYAQGPDLVRAVHRRLKVRKISDVPDDKCRELLDDATAILAQLKATSEPIDFLAMAGKK